MRPDHELYELDVHEWTAEEVLGHLRKTFDLTCEAFPEVMEKYVVQIADITDSAEQKSFMRAALRETLGRRRRDRPTAQAAE